MATQCFINQFYDLQRNYNIYQQKKREKGQVSPKRERVMRFFHYLRAQEFFIKLYNYEKNVFNAACCSNHYPRATYCR